MAFPCQVLQRRMAIFAAQPFGPGLFLCDAALLVAYLDDQTSLLVPCFAQKQAPARPRPKRQQTLRKTWFFCSSRCCKTRAVERAPISKQDLSVPNKVRPL
ncbi:MAG TPA: hypothetical protein DCR66_03365 [Pseudomonas sp.]|nr:hypothetical protein [Pseudomonas sp.]